MSTAKPYCTIMNTAFMEAVASHLVNLGQGGRQTQCP